MIGLIAAEKEERTQSQKVFLSYCATIYLLSSEMIVVVVFVFMEWQQSMAKTTTKGIRLSADAAVGDEQR